MLSDHSRSEERGAQQLPMKHLEVKTPRLTYPIYIGTKLFENLYDNIIKTHKMCPSKIAIISDETVSKTNIYSSLTKSFINSACTVHEITAPAGEKTKSFLYYEYILNELLSLGFDRKSLIIAVGGGVIGDLSGFIASTFMRGVSLIQAPTTLLAQVDSAVGGKTAINSKHGKNLIGTFYHPQCVVSDMGTLNTLPVRELKAGYAEILKYSLIQDEDFFYWLDQNGKKIINLDTEACEHAIMRSCKIKADIVERDEKDTSGLRALLNLGHTFAHAIEASCQYSNHVLHGEAVAVGIKLAYDLSVKINLCPAIDRARVCNHLNDMNINVNLRSIVGDIPPEKLVDFMLLDKKSQSSEIYLVLPSKIGCASLSSSPICKNIILNVLEEAISIY